MDGRTNEQTDGQKISPFYRTSSPIGAAALPPPMKTKEKVQQGKGTADHLMPLGYFLQLLVNCIRPKSGAVKQAKDQVLINRGKFNNL